jgi:hypothetical protein
MAKVYPLVGLTPPPGPIGWADASLSATVYLENLWLHLTPFEKPVFRFLWNPPEL